MSRVTGDDPAANVGQLPLDHWCVVESPCRIGRFGIRPVHGDLDVDAATIRVDAAAAVSRELPAGRSSRAHRHGHEQDRQPNHHAYWTAWPGEVRRAARRCVGSDRERRPSRDPDRAGNALGAKAVLRVMTSILRIAVAVAAISVGAPACGSGGAGSDAAAHLALRAAVKRGACLPAHPALSPYRGSLVFVRSDGGRVRVDAGSGGQARTSLGAGRYRLVPPLPGSTIHLELDGSAVTVIGHRYPLRIVAGRTARLAVVILPRRGECTATGFGA